MDLSLLNAPQRQAVIHGDTPLLVLAGAGTGKTTVITYRIAHLLEERGIAPDKILAVTFTNKAAREMRNRAGALSGLAPEALEIGTFHATCGRILRRYAPRLGLSPHFVIYDEDDQLRLLKRCMTDLKLDLGTYAPKRIHHSIDQWKNQGLAPSEVSPSQLDRLAQTALDVYRVYQERCLAAGGVDFGDLLLYALTLLKKEPDVRALLQRRWSHLLVDEYQDTNGVQYQWLQTLATPAHSLTVVGDDDQSIYRWRGADIGNILRFEQDFVGAQVIRLEQNYRSTQTILGAANAVIAHNVARKGKSMFTRGPTGGKLRLRIYATERDEGEAIAEEIGKALAHNLPAREIAALYRTNAQSRPIEDGLRRRQIAYAVYGGLRFYERREIKDALAYLRLLVNPLSEVDFLRVVNVPARGIGKRSLELLVELAVAHDCPLWEAVERFGSELPAKARKGLQGFLALMAEHRQLQPSVPAAQLCERLLEKSGYLEALAEESPEEAESRRENLSELVSAIDEFVVTGPEADLSAFLTQVALSADIDQLDAQADRVSLMTLHSAKGLEFELVFMPGLEEGLFPHERSLHDRGALEEERRLCYVGITRAKSELMLSAVHERGLFGSRTTALPSRFLAELPRELLDAGEAPAPALVVDRTESSQLRERSDPVHSVSRSGFVPGMRVFHASFGEGEIVAVDQTGTLEKLTIVFPGIGRKTIAARFVQKC